MQASKKILITTVGILLAILVSSLLVLRKDLNGIIEAQAKANPLISVPVESFQVIQLNGNWKVQIRQGRTHQVEMAFDPNSSYIPQLESRGDTLFFSITGDSTSTVEAKIVSPYIHAIQAYNGANIRLKKFELDSLTILLNDSHLIGEENKLLYTSYVTSGDSKLEFMDDPFK